MLPLKRRKRSCQRKSYQPADLAPEHLADSVEVLTATEKRSAIKTASAVSELPLTA
jgi:hypothetical protein